MKRELPKDVTGRTMDYRTQRREVSEYNRTNKRKPWNFPFREAFKRAGITK